MEEEVISERLQRINHLAHKNKTVGLTEEETIERDRLRKEYLADFRKNMVATLKNVYIKDEDGNEIQIAPKSDKGNNK